MNDEVKVKGKERDNQRRGNRLCVIYNDPCRVFKAADCYILSTNPSLLLKGLKWPVKVQKYEY